MITVKDNQDRTPTVEELKALRAKAVETHKAGRHVEALAAHSKAASIAPSDNNTRHNYGIALRDAGRFTESLAEFAAASGIDPNNANPRWDSAVSHLYLGDFAAGWAEYEWRWKTGEVEKRSSALPEWRGADPGGRAIYFYPEQGFDDTLLALRFLPWVKTQGAKVYLECKTPLRRLFAELDGVDEPTRWEIACWRDLVG